RKLDVISGTDIDRYPGLKIHMPEEFLAVAGKYGLHLFVDIGPDHEDKDLEDLYRIVESGGLLDRCSFISFSIDDLRKLRRMNPAVTFGYNLAIRNEADDIQAAKQLGHAFLNYYYPLVTQSYIRQCHEEGIEAGVWSLNDEDESRRLIQAGVDYITTDTTLHL